MREVRKYLLLIVVLVYSGSAWCQKEPSSLSLKVGALLLNEVNIGLYYATTTHTKVGLELGYIYPVRASHHYQICGARFWLPATRIVNHQGLIIRPSFMVASGKTSNFHSLHVEYGYTTSGHYYYNEACGTGASRADWDEFTEIWNTLGLSYRYNLVLKKAPRFYFHVGAGVKHKMIQRQYTVEADTHMGDTPSDRKEELTRNSLNLSVGINYFIIK